MADLPNSSHGARTIILLAAVKNLLRPLVRLALTHGITFPALAELLKSLYVEVARDEFALEEKRQTGSRISLLSGVHRKDVKRLSGLPDSSILPPPAVSLGAQLVARWISQPPYVDARRRPVPLPRLAANGGVRSFEALVMSVSKDIRARAVLDEWLRLGVAEVDEQDQVCLNVEAFIPEKGFEEKAWYFGHNLHDHLAAGVHNLSGKPPPFLERSVHYSKLTPASIEELAELSRIWGMRALQAINRRAARLERRDEVRNDARSRMTFGVYFFSAASDEQQSPPDKESSPSEAVDTFNQADITHPETPT